MRRPADEPGRKSRWPEHRARGSCGILCAACQRGEAGHRASQSADGVDENQSGSGQNLATTAISSAMKGLSRVALTLVFMLTTLAIQNRLPTLKTLGYFQQSLRDRANPSDCVVVKPSYW